MCENLTEPLDSEWNELINDSLEKDVHPGRIKGFVLSRMALRECLNQWKHGPAIMDLKLLSFNQLLRYPQYTISLSHTKFAGAALVADKEVYRSVGIDVEPIDRIMKDSILQRITHPEDINLRNIEIWCLKEAVFKALMNTGLFPHPLEFSSIAISDNKWSHSKSSLKGEWELDEGSSLIIARAFLKN